MRRFCVIYIVMFAAAWLLQQVTRLPSLYTLPPDDLRLYGSLGLAVALAAAVVLGGIAMENVPWYRDMAALMKRLLTNPELLGANLTGNLAFVIALYSGIAEEAFFRGWLQPWLIRLFGGWLEAPGSSPAVWLGIVGASLIFGLLHFPVVKELRPWTVFAVLVGVAFGVLAAWSGSLLGPILAHFLINWINLRRLGQLDLGEQPVPD